MSETDTPITDEAIKKYWGNGFAAKHLQPIMADLELGLREYQRTEPMKLAERNGLLRELAEYQSRDGTCDWAENQDGAYETSCGETFEFTDGGPKENKFKHCPYCGRRMENNQPQRRDASARPSGGAGSAGENK
jgi:hypothetical protein